MTPPTTPRTAAWERLLVELQENPLPGARHAYTIVRDRLPLILLEAEAAPGLREALLERALAELMDAIAKRDLPRWQDERVYEQARAALAAAYAGTPGGAE